MRTTPAHLNGSIRGRAGGCSGPRSPRLRRSTLIEPARDDNRSRRAAAERRIARAAYPNERPSHAKGLTSQDPCLQFP